MAHGDVAAVLRHYGGEVPEPLSGWQKMCCPFHPDENASAAVHFALSRFRCLGCMEQAEDAVGLIMWQEGCGYGLAQRNYQGIAGGGDVPVSGRSSRSSGLRSLLG